jgi:hypothetical protein
MYMLDIFALGLLIVNMFLGRPLLEYAESEEAQGELCKVILGKPTMRELQDMGLPSTEETTDVNGHNVEVRLVPVLHEVLLN